ncbi:MAG TPA: SCO family protein [Ignavibacteriaceae bacterium]|nr:SCO family protein [Ignavibacteriaceae bacterium]
MNKIILIAVSIFILFSLSCKEKLPLDKDLTKKSYNLINQEGEEVVFPEIIKGQITVMGFIFTHCPDICPMTTHNMYLTEKELKKANINEVKFIALSFDPDRDSPEVLKKFAEIRELDFNSWTLLTGKRTTVYELLKRFDVKAIKTDESVDEEGNSEYSMMHTDRISLIDENGRLRKNYKGSTLNVEELVNDIKTLKD